MGKGRKFFLLFIIFTQINFLHTSICNLKSIFKLTSFLTLIYTAHKTYKYSKLKQFIEKIVETDVKITKETVFIFDIHEVILTLDYKLVFENIIFCKQKFLLFSSFLYPKIYLNFLNLYENKNIGVEEIILELQKNYPKFKSLTDSIICDLCKSFKPIESTVKLIRKLKNKGHKLIILSNIDKYSFEYFKEKYDFFRLFDLTFIPNSQDYFLKKPEIAWFKTVLNKLNNAGYKTKNLVFIDDLIRNVIAAKSVGISSMLFTDPEAFENKCQVLGI